MYKTTENSKTWQYWQRDVCSINHAYLTLEYSKWENDFFSSRNKKDIPLKSYRVFLVKTNEVVNNVGIRRLKILKLENTIATWSLLSKSRISHSRKLEMTKRFFFLETRNIYLSIDIGLPGWKHVMQ
jgi:hypothetical protein